MAGLSSEEIRGVILRALRDKWLEVGHVGLWATRLFASDIATASGIPLNDVAREAQYLADRELLKDLGGGQALVATGEGIDYAQHPERFPSLAGFIQITQITARRDVVITDSQVGSVGEFRVSGGWDPAETLRALGELRGLIQAAELDEGVRHEASEDLEALEAQVRRPQINPPAVRALFQGLAATIQTAAAATQLDPQLLTRVQQLGAMIGRFLGSGGG